MALKNMRKRYIEKLDMELSPLGFGVMRVEQNADGGFPTDVDILFAMALEKGINYFDTAYPYLNGHSEELIRDALVLKFPRNSFYIADKLPVWDCHSREDMERIFNIQLERLGVDYIDFYLLHGLHHGRWLDIYNKGALDFLEEKRREGKIRKVGFSVHDTIETLKIIEGAYQWDFVQLQINYYDWVAQRAKENYEYLAARNIPCMVMEPVGGGRLSRLSSQAEKLLYNVRPNESAVAWALRFVAALPNVAVTLSGMATAKQLDENVKAFETIAPLSKPELDALNGVVETIQSKNPVPCSTCRYCVEGCPKGVDIPNIFQRYNDCKIFDNSDRFDVQYFVFIPDGKRADSCVSCEKCKKQCPQKIDIPRELKKIHDIAVGLSVGVDIEKLKSTMASGKQLVLFGAGVDGKRAWEALSESGIAVSFFCDNSIKLHGTRICGVPVISPNELDGLNDSIVVITSSLHHDEIKSQLDALGVSVIN
jgi:predicted aldo/keto reductase-like oxidoreductase